MNKETWNIFDSNCIFRYLKLLLNEKDGWKLFQLITRVISSIRDSSLVVHGAKLFNRMPQDIRDCTGCSVDAFKNKLDKYMDTIPDNPPHNNYKRALDSNSLLLIP